MKKMQAVCVYCGSSNNVDQVYKDAAQQLGAALGSTGVDVIYGGGRVGLMGITADAALSAGGNVIGIIPEHIQDQEVKHDHVTELHVVDSMHTRKQMMFERSDAFIVLPGGFGTLDELIEILTWRQLGLHDKPTIIVNLNGYWDKLMALFDHVVENNFAGPENLSFFQVVHTIEDTLNALPLMQAATIQTEIGRL